MAKLTSRIPQTKAAIDSEMGRHVLRVAHAIRNEMVKNIMRGQKSGRVYGNHQSSAPGESPANDTGALVRSIRIDHEPTSLKARVVVASAYGKMLELGTRKMAPRPYARPAVETVKKQHPELAKAIRIGVSK